MLLNELLGLEDVLDVGDAHCRRLVQLVPLGFDHHLRPHILNVGDYLIQVFFIFVLNEVVVR